MVVKSTFHMEWESNSASTSRPHSGDRCIPSWLGCSFRRNSHRGAVVRRGTGTAHQPLGVKRGCNGCENVRKAREEHVRLQMDNKTAIFYINRMGGTRSQNLVYPVCQLWQWCLQQGITLSAEYLPGVNNGIADEESCTMQSSAEWKLNPQVFICILQAMGPCQIDLFATRFNHQLNRYVSWRPDPFAVATDAFQMPWKDQQGYAFPPFVLVGKCLQKILLEESTVVLVAPVCETQPWYLFLLQLLIDYPLLSPAHSDLLRDPFERKHPLLLRHQLQLAAWKVSGINTWQQAFQRGLPDSFSQDGARVQTQFTSLVGRDGIAGVMKGKLIPFHVLSNHSWTF